MSFCFADNRYCGTPESGRRERERQPTPTYPLVPGRRMNVVSREVYNENLEARIAALETIRRRELGEPSGPWIGPDWWPEPIPVPIPARRPRVGVTGGGTGRPTGRGRGGFLFPSPFRRGSDVFAPRPGYRYARSNGGVGYGNARGSYPW